MDDNVSNRRTTSTPEVLSGAMLRERTDCYLDFTNEDYLKTNDFLGRITICDCSLNQCVLGSIFT